MGEIKIVLTSLSLMEAIHIPMDKDYRIIEIQVVEGQPIYANNQIFRDNFQIELIIQGDEFPPTPYNSEPVLVFPTIHKEPEKYFLDWNLPKGER